MLKITYTQNGATFVDSIHRATIGMLDLLTQQVLVVIKIYSNVEWMIAHPDSPMDRELIWVNPSDITQYFVPLSQGSAIPLQSAINAFLQTINPSADNTNYPDCRFDYTRATPV